MKQPKPVFVCQECGSQSPKWAGRCPDCNAWNSYAQEDAPAAALPATAMSGSSPMPIGAVDFDAAPRISTRIGSLDRVLGGGLVIGAVTLVGGEPGIGEDPLGGAAAASALFDHTYRGGFGDRQPSGGSSMGAR